MKKYIILILIGIMVFQVGCRPEQKQEQEQDISDLEAGEDLFVEATGEDRAILERSEDLSDYVVELFGVDDAATIILNDTALVGIVMAHDSELTEETRTLINDIVIDKDKQIKEVVISDDENIFQEVIKIINDLMNGRSYDNYVNSIDKLIKRANR